MLGLPFVELDQKIERAAGKSVADIFAVEGEAGFRAREAEAVQAAVRGPRSVISFGGGAVTSRAVRLAVRKSGHLLWLRAPLHLCIQRAASAPRPLLAGDAVKRMGELAAVREPIYARLADAVLEVVPQLSPESLAAQAAAAVARLEAQRAHS
jgi:shikimate kinase